MKWGFSDGGSSVRANSVVPRLTVCGLSWCWIRRCNGHAMFVRTKTFRNQDGTTRTYLQLVESVREGGRPRQRVVANLGRIEELEAGKLDAIIASLARFSQSTWRRLEQQAEDRKSTRLNSSHVKI